MPVPVRTSILAVAAFAVLVSLLPRLGQARVPGDHQGYRPTQPIAYSHRLHAGELGIDCLYCHGGAERSRHAGIPSANVCMNCHRFVAAPWGEVLAEQARAKTEGRPPRRLVSPEIRKLYDALGLNDEGERDPAKTPSPIRWKQVHRVPDFVYFDHRAHVAAGVACQKCHGSVETMERVRQEENLSMGWCVNCHRDAHANGIGGRKVAPSTDCAACHY